MALQMSVRRSVRGWRALKIQTQTARNQTTKLQVTPTQAARRPANHLQLLPRTAAQPGAIRTLLTQLSTILVLMDRR